MSDTYHFPPLYDPWVRQLVGDVPAETKATCDTCVMCASEDPTARATFFHPDAKCCTYVPGLPNFLVGRILDDESPEAAAGRSTVVDRIAQRVSVTPWGLEQPRLFRTLYNNGRQNFGRAPDLRCPHYIEGAGAGCGIWRHRPGVCATWFCKYVRGKRGMDFWQRLAHLFRETEVTLGIWCAYELGVRTPDLLQLLDGRNSALIPSDLGADVDAAAYSRLWGSWENREPDFYRDSARLVAQLDWAAIEQIGGTRLRLLADVVRQDHQNLLSTEIPQRLKAVVFQIDGMASGKYYLTTYSNYDPLLMPETLLRILPYFDGRPTAEALEAIRTEHHVRVQPGLLLRMVDFGILASADPGPTFPILP